MMHSVTVEEVAERFGIKVSSASTWLSKWKARGYLERVKGTPRGRYKAGKRSWADFILGEGTNVKEVKDRLTSVQISAIPKMRDLGMTFSKIGEILDVSDATAYRHAHSSKRGGLRHCTKPRKSRMSIASHLSRVK